MTDRIAATIRATLDAATGPRRANGAVVSIRAADKAWTAAVGRADGPPPAPDSPFLLYSVTKTIVAAALLRLAAAERLALDRTLEAWLPESPVAGRITLRQVLQHRSGLPDYGGLADYHAAVRSGGPPWSEAEFLARTGADRLIFEPGRGWAYSNIGYMLLRRVLERAGGAGLAAILKREIFDPVGATSASVPRSRKDLARFTFGPSPYLGGDGPAVRVADRYHPGWIATGVVGARVADAARILHGLFTADLLPAALLRAMRRAVHVGGPFPDRPWVAGRYGLGLMVATTPAKETVCGHTGGGPGCSSAVFHFPRRDPPLTIAGVTDGEDLGQAETLVLAVARCLDADLDGRH